MKNMEKEIKTSLFVEDGVRVMAYLSDFNNDVNDWKKSFYEIWRYQMTWDFVFEIKIYEVHGGDICVSMLIKKSYSNNVLDMMEYLGYANVRITEEHVGIVQVWDIDDPVADDLFTVVAD